MIDLYRLSRLLNPLLLNIGWICVIFSLGDMGNRADLANMTRNNQSHAVIEQLEDRRLMTSVNLLDSGILDIQANADTANIVRVNTTKSSVRVRVNRDPAEMFSLDLVQSIQITGGHLSDRITAKGWLPITVLAHGGNDLIRTGHGNDSVDAGDGDDRIWTGKGNDTINGGTGADQVLTGIGTDTIFEDTADRRRDFKTDLDQLAQLPPVGATPTPPTQPTDPWLPPSPTQPTDPTDPNPFPPPTTPPVDPNVAAPEFAPTDVAATPVSDTEINLTWERVGTGETSITIWRANGNGPYQRLTKLPAGSNIYTDTSCYPDATYNYRLTTDNAGGSSPLSDAKSAATKPSAATLTPASELAATAISPFDISLTWTDPNSGFRNWLIERSSDGVSYSIIKVVGGSAASASYTDTTLTPSTTYHYRIRMVSGVGYSNYTAPVVATTAARPAAAPLEPTGLAANVESATRVTLNWTDTNSGASRYVIETARFSWTNNPSWTQAAITDHGATSYTLTTTAETFYYARIRARTSDGDSGHSTRVVFRTASPGIGSPQTYEIGPGKTYTSLAALDWSKLGPGDTVYIHPNKDANGTIIPYFEKPLISTRGTAAAPINIIGVKDPSTGQMPIFDGTNAVSAAQWNSHYMPLEDLGLIVVGTRTEQHQRDNAWSPGYLNLSGFEIRNAYQGDPGQTRSYTAHNGSSRNYYAAYGIYIEKGDHITLKGNEIHGNTGGVFAAGQGEPRNVEYLTLDGNWIYGNGRIKDYLEHNTYIEGINTLYQYNKYGPLRSGSPGAALKDRGAGTVIRYNYIENGAHLIDLVETQNYYGAIMPMSSYNKTYVYGNVLFNTQAATPIHYGGDQGVKPNNRKGTLYFYNNTLYNQMDQTSDGGGGMWRVNVFQLDSSADTLDARNNIINFCPKTSGAGVPDIDLLTNRGVAYFSTNWISAGWSVSRDGGVGFVGRAAGLASTINNTANAPGFVDPDARDFRLTSGSQAIDLGIALPADVARPLFVYSFDRLGNSRPLFGSGLDLGAYEWF